MKTLYLLRHAKSEPAQPLQKDFDRCLSESGELDAAVIAQRLYDSGARPDLIFSSPAERAQATAGVFARQFKLDSQALVLEPQIYMAGSGRLLQILRQLDDNVQSVVLIGHNPALTDFCNELCEEDRIDHIPTCGLMVLSLPVMHWQDVAPGQGRIIKYDFPGKVK